MVLGVDTCMIVSDQFPSMKDSDGFVGQSLPSPLVLTGLESWCTNSLLFLSRVNGI